MAGQTVVIIGGGIAGTTCAEYISSFSKEINVILIAPTDVIKTAATSNKISRLLNELQVSEKSADSFEDQFSNVSVQVGLATGVNCDEKYVITSDGSEIKYDKLCICTGGKPKIIAENNPYVVSIRDTDTVEKMQSMLQKARKVVVVGNGGIALELVYEVIGCEVVWCIKDEYIGTKYLDNGASTFLMPSLKEQLQQHEDAHGRKADQVVFKRRKYQTERSQINNKNEGNVNVGSALGPDWCAARVLQGSDGYAIERKVEVKYNCHVKQTYTREQYTNMEKFDELGSYNVYIEFTDGSIIGADFVISATGVTPNSDLAFTSKEPLNLSDGGICVDENMRSNLQDVYAAGDVCHATWEHAKHWFPMKLWTQGWQMGAFAGKCIVEHFQGSDLPLDFCFELFTHMTTFFGYKICLLGCYNAQKLEDEEFDFLVRFTEGMEYIKLVMSNGRVQGGVLIGDTDLEETIENLILNQIDVGFLGESLLDPNVDIEDYFD